MNNLDQNIVNYFNGHKVNKKIINRENVYQVIKDVRKLFYVGYFEKVCDCCDYVTKLLNNIKENLMLEIKNTIEKRNIEELVDIFISKLPEIKETLDLDIEAFLENDPAANGRDEIILSYPGFYAILVYRLAHELYKLNIKMLPRIMSEYAHAGTAIDINPGAEIGKYFFIDHGSGVVIGETSIIGDHVRIYQGVTIGAKNLKKGSKLRGLKRHPTIKNNVIIYANASILGGDTVIGNNVIVGSNVFILESIDDNTKVLNKDYDLTLLKG